MECVQPDDCPVCTDNVCDVPGPRIDPHIPDLLTLAQAAEILKVSRGHAHRILMDGDLSGKQAGTTWLFRPEVVYEVKRKRAK